jgi:hypothetical protein
VRDHPPRRPIRSSSRLERKVSRATERLVYPPPTYPLSVDADKRTWHLFATPIPAAAGLARPAGVSLPGPELCSSRCPGKGSSRHHVALFRDPSVNYSPSQRDPLHGGSSFVYASKGLKLRARRRRAATLSQRIF